ncbi:phosphopantetheine-binding protein [Streptomyces sp. QTS52]
MRGEVSQKTLPSIRPDCVPARRPTPARIVTTGEISPEVSFDELDLDSTEALILAGEMENRHGFELSTTALW